MITALFLALLLAHRPAAPAAVPPTPVVRPTIPVQRLYLPVLVGWPAPVVPRTPTPSPTAMVDRAVHPGDAFALRRALQTPGAFVQPMPGEYTSRVSWKLAPGVTLDGRGAVVIRGGQGVELYKADGASVRNLTVTGSDGDAIKVNKTRAAVLANLNLSDAGDGLIDITNAPPGGAFITVRDSILHDHVKGALIGHQAVPGEAAMAVRLERVRFIRVQARTPKIHLATVTMVDSLVQDWVGAGCDVQQGGHISLIRVRFEAGKKSGARCITATGGTITEEGTEYVPWGGRQ